MKKLTLLLCLISSASLAAEVQFGFKSPAFNGNGYSAHVLTIENLEQTRKQKIIDDQKAAAAQAAAEAKNTNLARFLNNLESRIYATLSQKIAEELFKQNGQTSGQFTVSGTTIYWQNRGSTIYVRITDPAGHVTEMEVPFGSLGF
jgi:hypothetical protein